MHGTLGEQPPRRPRPGACWRVRRTDGCPPCKTRWVTRHRQSYELLPRGIEPGQREPAGRMIGLLLIVLVVVALVGFAAWTLISRTTFDSGEAATTPTGEPSVRVAPTPSQATPQKTPPRTIAAGSATIPETLMLPHEADALWSGANLKLETCQNTNPERGVIDQAVDIRTIASQLDDLERTETLVVASDEGSANALFDRLAQAMTSCTRPSESAEPEPIPTRTTALNLLDDGQHLNTDWDRAGIFAVTFPSPDSGDPEVNSYLVLGRAGRSLVAASISGSTVPGPTKAGLNPSIESSLQAFLDEMAPRVCIFKQIGCGPLPPPPPSPPPHFPADSLLMPDGTVLLADGTIVQAENGLPVGQTPPPPTPTAAAT